MDRSIVNPFAPKEARLTFVANCLSDSEYIRLFQILNSRDFADHPNPFTEPAGFRGMCPAFVDGATSQISSLYYCIDFLHKNFPALDERLYSYLQRHVNPLAFRLQQQQHQGPTQAYHPQTYHNNWHQDQVHIT